MTVAVHEPWQHHTVDLDGLRLHYVEAGAGNLVVLLHGFPEFWYSWRRQIPVLANAGLNVVAPDLRGYNESGKPLGVRNYRLDLLTDDLANLIRHKGAKRAFIVGHDWGGVIAWNLAMRFPDIVEKLIVLNAPHPAAFRRELRDPSQWLRSWYILFFQLPWLPEIALRRKNYAWLERAFRKQTVHPEAFSLEDIEHYKHALDQPGALTAALNYYRAGLRYFGKTVRHIRLITAPTLLIWGERDPFLGIGLSENLNRWVPSLCVERLADAGHWVQNDVPDTVNRLLLDFLRPTGQKSALQ